MQESRFPTTVGIGYRADIDGLRAIAVLSVLAFHYGARFPGGFTGVDVFFVISGFLITSHIADEIRADTFSVLGFYDRRVRRILPALLVMLAVTLFAGKFLLMPGDYKALGGSTAAAAFGFSNFFFLAHTGYFDQSADLMPLLHTWSLAVEEQFYIVWPLLLLIIASGRKRLVAAASVSAIVIVGFGASLVWFDVNPKAAFFVAAPRAWELAIGAALVFLPELPRRLGGATAFGLVLIVAGFFQIKAASFPGVAALLPCVGAALVIWPKQQPARMDRWLGLLSPIGLISYSLYLWHWPVWVLFRIYVNGGVPQIREAIALAAVSILLAFLSWRYIELPFRKRIWPPRQTVCAGALACMLVYCGAMYVDRAEGLPKRISPEAYAMRSLEAMWDWHCPNYDQLPQLSGQYCFFGRPWKEAKRKVLIWGDSHADHFAPIIQAAVKDYPGDAFMVYTSCPAALGGHVTRDDLPGYSDHCRSQRDNAIKLLRDDPVIGLVILASSWAYLPNLIVQDGSLRGNDRVEWLASGLTDLIARTEIPGRKFLIIGSVPQHQVDPTLCAFSQSNLLRAPCRPVEADQSFLRGFTQQTDRMILKIAADHPDVVAVIPSKALCAGATCATFLNGEFLYRDASHIRRNLSEATKRRLAELIGLTAALVDRPILRVEASPTRSSE
jgi:peptidoglycan/LPS O-acetylase OafA/YrhL